MNEITGGITSVNGVLTSGINCGIKPEKKDLALIYSKTPATAVAVVTTNQLKGASLIVTQQHLKNSFPIQAIIINSGNANTCTGTQGLEDATSMTRITADQLGIPIDSVLVASTGVIGKPLPMNKIEKGIPPLIKSLGAESADAAEAILTTDTKTKESAVEFVLSNGIKARIGGMAKGAGMICPDVATMLSFIATDVAITQPSLKAALLTASNNSFNLMTIDGDTSPCDMVVLFANGFAGNEKIVKSTDEDFKIFQQALNLVCLNLATKMVKDGEGITKLLKIKVVGAKTSAAARQVAMAIAKSQLVKCAFYGEDPNWGRIINACGYSGVAINPEKIDIYFDRELIVKNGVGINFDLASVKNILANEEILITIDLKQGRQQITVLGCDLSEENVSLNAHYTT
ncbi:MAG: bifunctional glutamate N-acetyltransferase/amino-acid acetyltransferase ArgJ [bacterium]|nr:bifunctional glutamate N-acetyltransferase/amino-acid acetyltransferase ArgJ [bacterium]